MLIASGYEDFHEAIAIYGHDNYYFFKLKKCSGKSEPNNTVQRRADGMITIKETPAETTAERINEADKGKTIDEIYHDESENDAFERFLAAQDMYLMMKQEGLI